MACAKSLAHLLTLVAFSVVTAGCSSFPYNPPPLAFSGESAAAKETLVVPTLDTPAPKGKNVIWCATFQLCWDELRQVVDENDLPEAQEVTRRLDAARIDTSTLPPDAYYAAAGRTSEGIAARIRSQMAAKFPQVKPELPANTSDMVALAYSYLNATVKFRTAYFDREAGDEFTDSTGNKTRVSSFGLYEKSREASINTALGRQLEVLYSGSGYQPTEFVLDLDRNSRSSQLILACVEPKESLAATWKEVQRRMQAWQPEQDEREFGEFDRLAVPNVNYRLQHSFKELDSSGIVKTLQAIEFRLDRSGAAVASEAYYAVAAMGRSFHFTRPFLIAMRKRGCSEPYFVMWVDNAELLCKSSVR